MLYIAEKWSPWPETARCISKWSTEAIWTPLAESLLFHGGGGNLPVAANRRSIPYSRPRRSIPTSLSPFRLSLSRERERESERERERERERSIDGESDGESDGERGGGDLEG